MAIAGNKLVNLAGAKVLYDDLRARIEALEADIATEDSATATAAHAVGDIILVGGALYSVTAAIAIGDTITAEGNSANVTATTVAAVIEAAVGNIDLSTLATKANPTFTGTLTLGSTSMNETQLSGLLSLTSASGVSF